uniref:PilZ domain-containing protein n=1 Tax=Steinernema glaseri TaxID=37863 RepID=A0A1I8AF99_9BILA
MVVENQEERFLSDEKLRLLSRADTPVVYRAIPFGPTEERQRRFLLDCQQLLILVTVPSLGLNFDFHLTSVEHREESSEVKTYFESPLIFNGVCVKWVGHIGQSTLRGAGHFVFDSERARALEELRREEALRYQTRIDSICSRFRVPG